MTQPDYVPLQAPDRIRASDRISLPRRWKGDRPGELAALAPPSGRHLGATGPDLGYGLKLAKRFSDRLILTPGEDPHDVLAGVFVSGARRAATFGRAPVIYDMEWAYTIWGFLGSAADDLVAFRVPLFRGVGHDYEDQRRLCDTIAEGSLALTPAEARERVVAGWQSLFTVA